jgi:hypothetical protein
MNNFGIGAGYLIVQIINITIILGWIVLGIYSIRILRHCNLSTEAGALWVLIIVGIPLLGAITFLVIHSKDKKTDK